MKKSIFPECVRTVSRCFGIPKSEQFIPVQKLILRMPRVSEDEECMEEMDYQVTTLRYVSCRLRLPVPQVVNHDKYANNPLRLPYMIQQRL